MRSNGWLKDLFETLQTLRFRKVRRLKSRPQKSRRELTSRIPTDVQALETRRLLSGTAIVAANAGNNGILDHGFESMYFTGHSEGMNDHATITISENGIDLGSSTTSSGYFWQSVNLSIGQHELTLSAAGTDATTGESAVATTTLDVIVAGEESAPSMVAQTAGNNGILDHGTESMYFSGHSNGLDDHATVTISEGETQLATTTTSSGYFWASLNLAIGDHELTVTTSGTDAQTGTTATATTTLDVTVPPETTAPSLVALNAGSSGNLTNGAEAMYFSGHSNGLDDHATITISEGSTQLATTTTSSGYFWASLNLSSGEHSLTFSGSGIDAQTGLSATATSTLSVTVPGSSVTPTLTAESAGNNGILNHGFESMYFRGSTGGLNDNATIIISEDGEELGRTTTASGYYWASLNLAIGQHLLTFVAQGTNAETGSPASASTTFSITVAGETAAPSFVAANAGNSGTLNHGFEAMYFSGHSNGLDDHATVTIREGATLLATTTTSSGYIWVSLNLPIGNHTLTFTASGTDVQTGTDATATTTLDVTVPTETAAPSLVALNAGSSGTNTNGSEAMYFSGHTNGLDDYATITISEGSTQLATTTTASGYFWSSLNLSIGLHTLTFVATGTDALTGVAATTTTTLSVTVSTVDSTPTITVQTTSVGNPINGIATVDLAGNVSNLDSGATVVVSEGGAILSTSMTDDDTIASTVQLTVGEHTLTITVSGTNTITRQSDSATTTLLVTINVTATLQPPVGTENTVSTFENLPRAIWPADFGFTDPHNNPAHNFTGVKITSGPFEGTMSDFETPVTVGQFIPLSDLVNGDLIFSPTPYWTSTANSYAGFGFQVEDDSPTANIDPAPKMMFINVMPVAQAPSGTSNAVEMWENTPYALKTADFGFTDPHDSPANAFAAVEITTLPTIGTLTDYGTPVTAGQFVSVADINAGSLVYTSETDQFGSGYSTLAFQVQDNGSTQYPGENLDPTPKSLTFDVTAASNAWETHVNTYTTSNQVNPSVASDAAGDYVVTWQSSLQDGSGYGVYAQRYNPVGREQGGEFLVNTYTTGDQETPKVAMDSAGNFVITWQSSGQDGSDDGIFAQRYSSAGIAQGSEFRVNTTTVFNESQPSVAMDAAGNFVIAWQQQYQSESDTYEAVYAQRYNDSGVAEGGNFQVNLQSNSEDSAPSVAMDQAGNFVIAFQDDGDIPGVPSGHAVLVQCYNAVGVAQGVNLVVAADTPRNFQQSPSVAMDGTGDFVVAWGSADSVGSGYGVYAQRYSPLGVAQGDVFPINYDLTGNQAFLSASMDAAGDFVVTWESSINQGRSGYGVYAQRYWAGGDARAGEFELNTYTAGDQRHPVAAMDSAGDLVVAWQSNGQDGSGYGIYSYHSQLAPFVTQAPVGTANTVTTLENTAYTFATSDFGFTDPHNTPANTFTAVKITTLPSAGTLTDDGVAVTVGQFVSVADIGSGNLVFTPSTYGSGVAYASFTFQDQDDGSTVNGGVNLEPIPKSMTINVTAVTQAPVGTSNTVMTLENTAYTFSSADFGFTDPHNSTANAFTAVEISTLPAVGLLTIDGIAATEGQFVTVADINSGKLVFAPATYGAGAAYASFTFQDQDDGSTDNGGVNLAAPKTMTINVTPVTQAPMGTSNTVNALENAAYTFTTADFVFADPNNSPAKTFTAVEITTLPVDGTLTDNGVAVIAGQFVNVDDIDGGNLVFTAATNAYGAGYASFTFQDQDDGSTDNRGVNLDPILRR